MWFQEASGDPATCSVDAAGSVPLTYFRDFSIEMIIAMMIMFIGTETLVTQLENER
jgi:hypothetical protein